MLIWFYSRGIYNRTKFQLSILIFIQRFRGKYARDIFKLSSRTRLARFHFFPLPETNSPEGGIDFRPFLSPHRSILPFHFPFNLVNGTRSVPAWLINRDRDAGGASCEKYPSPNYSVFFSSIHIPRFERNMISFSKNSFHSLYSIILNTRMDERYEILFFRL